MSEFENILLNGTLYTLGGGSGLTADIKTALLQIAQKVAYIDDDGQDYYDALYAALYPPANLVSISCVYTQSGTVYDTASLDDLKADLVVTATFADSTTQTVTGYTLSGTLTEGTSTITVSYAGKTTTFNVTVTEFVPLTAPITWSGVGSEKWTSTIDATQYDVYIEVPFIANDSHIKSGATAEDTFIERAKLYTDAECTNLAGYWFIDTQQIEQSERNVSTCPWFSFDEKVKIAPKGYYVQFMLENRKSTVFVDNYNCYQYLNNNVASVTLM